MSIEGRLHEIKTCFDCNNNKLLIDQIAVNKEKYQTIINKELNSVPEKPVNSLTIAYCRGAIDQLEDILTLPKRAAIMLEEALKGQELKVTEQKKFDSKQKGRI